jgi:hypothetical protein
MGWREEEKAELQGSVEAHEDDGAARPGRGQHGFQDWRMGQHRRWG